MDQEAFRNLISTSSALAGPSGSTGNRSFGKAHKRSAPPTSFTRPSDLKPRKLKRDSTYTDRASARRSGTTNEFDDVEELHRDFEERIAAAETEEERQRLRDQISSVGGDARYSVLVKGLDWGLLAQNKARVERENGGYEQGGGEGELEVAYQEGRAGDDGEGEGKRSREDIVEAIRRRREAKGALKDEPKTGFRPIGFKPIGGPDKQEEGLAEYKWVGGKRMRKKKKLEAAPVEEELASKEAEQVKAVQGAKMDPIRRDASEVVPTPVAIKQSSASAAGTSMRAVGPNRQISASSSANRTPSPPKRPVEPAEEKVKPTATIEEDDEDEDIFADVGGWDGIAESKDDADDTASADGSDEAGALSSPIADRASTPPPATTAPLVDPDSPVKDARSPSPTRPEPAQLALDASLPAVSANVPALPLSPDSIASQTVSAPPAAESEPAPALEASKPKPKKSKWDDDEPSAKKKKKKRH